MDLLSSWTFYALLGGNLLVILYWYLTRNFKFWSKQGINGPKPIPLFGNLLDQFITPQPITELRWFREYGKIFGYYMGKTPVLSVAEPELIKTIMVKDFHLFPDRRPQRSHHPIMSKMLVDARGDDWKRIRSIASPTFTSGKMKKMYPMIKQCLNEFLDVLEEYAKDGKDMNAKDMYGNYTMDVIATCAFATKTNAHKDTDNPFVTNAKKIFNFNLWRIIPLLLLPVSVLKLLKLRNNIDATDFFIDSTRYIMQNRRKSDKKYNDFIQLLMDAEKDKESIHDVNDVNEAHHVNEGEDELAVEKKALNINLVNKHLTEEEILAQALIFFLAGYETTATTLTYATYEMAMNARVQERLYCEVNSAIDSKGDISYEELAKLEYLDAVLSETLRLHSPALRIARTVSTDYKLGDTGIKLSKGQLVEIPVYAIHHSEEFYENPYEFRPERFLPENRHQIKPYTYLPFGAGPRNCIGMRFALLEAKLGLAQIIKRYRFVRSSQTEVPLKYRRTLRLSSPKSVVVGIQKRIVLNN